MIDINENDEKDWFLMILCIISAISFTILIALIM